MTRFPEKDDDAIVPAVNSAREVLGELGLTMHLANDRSADDELFGNVAAHIWGCKFGIALLETHGEEAEQLNDNVLIEMGAMLVTGRRCVLLKDVSAPDLPTDFVAQIYKTLDLTDISAVRSALRRWVSDDLGLLK